uniref:Uncharacterized protein n=1 Tax=Cyprinodon variegatus TaxID=28743 RepID=A0A3Q2GQG2_CYPVA
MLTDVFKPGLVNRSIETTRMRCLALWEEPAVNLDGLFAGNIVLELSKDKHNASFLDRQLVQFQTSINRVESELSAQIRYLTQVRKDSGKSCYKIKLYSS